MLLRRMIEHVRTQNWTAVILDFVIVVVGVFLGLQLGNWNESRARDALARQSPIQLRDEFAEIDGAAAGLEEFYDDLVESLTVLVDAVDAGSVAQSDEPVIRDALAYAEVFADPPPHSGAFRDLEGAGNLALIDNLSLRLRLIEYDESLENIAAGDAAINAVLAEFSMPMKRHVDFAPDYFIPDRENFAFQDIRLPMPQSIDYEAMLADPEFRVAAQQHLRLQIGRAVNVKVCRSKIAQIRALLDQELEGQSP